MGKHQVFFLSKSKQFNTINLLAYIWSVYDIIKLELISVPTEIEKYNAVAGIKSKIMRFYE